jgi:hypothetical protein
MPRHDPADGAERDRSLVRPTGTSLPDVIGAEAPRKVSAATVRRTSSTNLLIAPSVASTRQSPNLTRVPSRSAAEAGVHAERWRCIKIRSRRCLRGRGRDCQIARRTRDNRALAVVLAAMRYPARPSASCGAGTPFHRSPSLPRCTDARSASQATPPANFSILALRSGGVERTRAVHGSCRDVGVGDGRNGRAAMPA